ncbi:phytoene desaturase [Adhaeribacter sp. BT258]|uniref:Phytoene desaturase n=1 Tax=Adhaeribacter terrigena TaxID=2793070 RepID=A0ABS1C4A1_9BACT|nr:1-hydroxycarotenoid 3,4-desaturase CrtD [Adhaeribacter terrigena]MBK0404232.1 phytoene desaturase [Adhaeribacter terrigena]
MKTAAVIGSGVAGLATAIRLALQHFEVTVFEANSTFGGKMTEFSMEGYRFDKGPSLFTMPHLVDDLFYAAGRFPTDYFRYQILEIITKYHFADGTELHAYHDPHKFQEEVERTLGIPKKKVKWFLKRSAQLYNATSSTFLHKSLHKFSTYFSPDILKTLAAVPRLGLRKTMHQTNARDFEDPRFVQLLDRFATYNGSDPYQAPATLNIIPHLEHNIGAFYPENGIISIAKSLHKLAVELGVKFRFNEKAEEITLAENRKKVTGLRTAQATYQFDAVVSNMDVVPTYRKLLPTLKAPEKTLRQPRSSSALIFYWGINRTFPDLHLHNIFFSQDYKKEFEHIFKHKTISQDPTIYVNITSKFTKSDAPENAENWFVMVNVPHNEGQDWDKLIAETRQHVLQKLSRHLKTDLQNHLACEKTWDPRGIELETGSVGGALYGSSSNNAMAAFLRHPNFKRKVKGLYFCGGSVHPGGGIPLCLLSAKIVSNLVKNDYR